MRPDLFIIGAPKCATISLFDWLTDHPNNLIKVLLMETMIHEPDDTVRSILGWLGLDPDRLPQLAHTGRNRTEEVRLPGLQAIVRRLNAKIRPPDTIRRLAKKVYSAFQFRKPKPIAPEDAAALHRLKAGFASDNAELAEITGLDLTVWSSGTQAIGKSDR